MTRAVIAERRGERSATASELVHGGAGRLMALISFTARHSRRCILQHYVHCLSPGIRVTHGKHSGSGVQGSILDIGQVTRRYQDMMKICAMRVVADSWVWYSMLQFRDHMRSTILYHRPQALSCSREMHYHGCIVLYVDYSRS